MPLGWAALFLPCCLENTGPWVPTQPFPCRLDQPRFVCFALAALLGTALADLLSHDLYAEVYAMNVALQLIGVDIQRNDILLIITK